MGEIAVSATPGDELVAIGLGSCIGLALVDQVSGVAGLAHVVLPDSGPAGAADGAAGKFADSAVPELIARVEALGAVKRRLVAVLVGGAQMFARSNSLDIGRRNASAVTDALREAGIRIHATETGGSQGRTARVIVGREVTAHVAGGERTTLLAVRAARRAGLAGAPS